MSLPTLHRSRRASTVWAPAGPVWAVVASGRSGPQWYADAAPLVARGALDRLVGGAGRRWEPPGRPLLADGDTVGFWRVLEAGPLVTPAVGSARPARHPARHAAGHRLLLQAEVRSPGRVLLRTDVLPAPAACRVEQEVSFEPAGLLGRAYLVADLPARELLLEVVHRRLLQDLEELVSRPGTDL